MISVVILLKSFFILLLLSAGVLLTGSFLSRRTGQETVFNGRSFQTVFLLVLFLISAYAIFRTGGRTVLLPAPLFHTSPNPAI